MSNKKHLIILGHGEGDGGALGVVKSERLHLLDLGRELRILINAFSLPVVLEDTKNIYKRNDFQKNPTYYRSFESVTEIHFNSDSTGKATGGEILFAEGLVADKMDKRFEQYLRNHFGFRRYIKSNWYQQTRVAKQLSIPSYRLVEICFCNNPVDIQKFMGKERYHAQKILEVITQRTLEVEDRKIQPFSTTYIIQLGAFNQLENAQKQLKEIQKHFKDAFIRRVK